VPERQIMAGGPAALSDDLITKVLKGTIILYDVHRAEIWGRSEPGPRIICRYKVQTSEQVEALRRYFEPYTRKNLDLPWYEGILSEALTEKLSVIWAEGKAGFDLLFDRNHEDMVTAAQLLTLIERGGEFQRVIYFDKVNKDRFTHTIQYSVNVGDAARHIVLYSIVYHLQ
jgi:hypothetical protein